VILPFPFGRLQQITKYRGRDHDVFVGKNKQSLTSCPCDSHECEVHNARIAEEHDCLAVGSLRIMGSVRPKGYPSRVKPEYRESLTASHSVISHSVISPSKE